ncbi:MAG: MFS transporter [Proteobacteria bacterium]|nr:MFS transporter [Pseudomonadota bacterium]
MKRLPATVIALGLVSFLTDLSSEMIYPLLPVFLSTVLGGGALALGVIEGLAESTAALFKLISGIWTDRTRRRKPFLLAGYGLAGLVRPLIGLAGHWTTVAAIRFTDRLGKGVRTSPRDALIADVVAPEQRGRAYGLHRAMDHAGAVAGPLVAAALLTIEGFTMRGVFLMAAIPAAAVILVLVFGVKELPARPGPPASESEPSAGRRELGRDFRLFLLALVLFTLGNSTDAFLLLRLSEAGVPAASVALLWSLHHVVKTLSTYVGGRLSDRMGRRTMILGGWSVYAAVYLAFALVDGRGGLITVFLLYGLYFGLTEPSEKAWVVDLVPASVRGTAFGYYHGAIGLAALPASLIFGLLWHFLGAATAFIAGAALAASAVVPLLLMGRAKKIGTDLPPGP